jgi:hypothetical protein
MHIKKRHVVHPGLCKLQASLISIRSSTICAAYGMARRHWHRSSCEDFAAFRIANVEVNAM